MLNAGQFINAKSLPIYKLLQISTKHAKAAFMKLLILTILLLGVQYTSWAYNIHCFSNDKADCKSDKLKIDTCADSNCGDGSYLHQNQSGDWNCTRDLGSIKPIIDCRYRRPHGVYCFGNETDCKNQRVKGIACKDPSCVNGSYLHKN